MTHLLRFGLLLYTLCSKAFQQPRFIDQTAFKQRLLTRVLRTVALIPVLANAVDRKPISNNGFRKALLNAPSQDFFYPPYMIGRWNTTLTFSNANFTDKVPMETLAKVCLSSAVRLKFLG